MIKNLSYKFLDSVAAIFIFLFAYTSISKLFKMQQFEFTIKSSPLIANWSSVIAWSVVFLEWLAVLFLLYHPVRWLGFYISLFLMSLFTFYIACMLITVSSLPCSCGGILKQLSWKAHLFLNIGLTLLSLLAVIIETKRRRSIVKYKS